MSETREILLLRHGATEANEQHRYCGKTDLSLSPSGKASLLCKQRSLLYPNLSDFFICTSGMKRTNETLALLYPNDSVRAHTIPAFQEIDFGSFENRSYEELRDSPSYQAWISPNFPDESNDKNQCPNGESGEEMKTRVLSQLHELLRTHERIAIFTHGGPISAIMAFYFPEEHKNRYQWQSDFGEGWRIVISHDDKGETRTYEHIPRTQEGTK